MRRIFIFLWAVSGGWGALLTAQPAPLAVDPAVREESRQFYRAIHARSELVPMQWTGNPATGNAGDTSEAFKEAVRLRINYYRAMAGVPAAVALSPALNAKAQQAALLMGANNMIAATPPAAWTFYSGDAAEAAANSNLILGLTGAEAITAQVRGEGDANAALAQRRWLLYPWSKFMGTGDVPAAGLLQAANATWVRDTANATGPRPATRNPFVAWPPPGYVPYPVVFPRWSFSLPGADFSAATVTMARGETAVPVRREAVANGAGENTLVWVYDNLDARLVATHAKPAADTTYRVTIAGVRGSGVPAEFSYEVTVFDPDAAGPSERQTTVNGSITPAVGQANPYNVFLPALAANVDWRRVQLAASTPVFGAESEALDLVATTTGTYRVRDLTRPDTGVAAYRLTLETAEPQILLLPGTYFSPLGAPGALSFRGLFTSARATEKARVQVSDDDGAVWREAFAEVGGAGDSTYRSRTVSLADYAGRTIRVRFLLSTEGGPSGATWYLDGITLAGVRTVAPGSPERVPSEGVFRLTPSAPGPLHLQARGVMAGGWAMEWGPVLHAVAVGPGGAGDPGRLVNLAIRTQAGTGARTLIMGLGIGGTGTSGTKPLLVRGVGPSLGAFGVEGYLVDPVLSLRSGTVVLASNDNWDNNGQVAQLAAQVGAFPLASASSRDAAVVTARPAGPYTVQIAGAGDATGIALAEVYDGTAAGAFASTTPRLANVSARAEVGAGGDVLIAGFTIGGSTEKTLLIRAIGPTLATFGVAGALADPKLDLYDSGGRLVTANDNWLSTSILRIASGNVGAFSLPEGSRDAAVLVTLLPGSYTAQVSGVAGGTGVGLVEVYEVP